MFVLGGQGVFVFRRKFSTWNLSLWMTLSVIIIATKKVLRKKVEMM